jgi:uncharacterized protein (TIGR03643 family)
LNLLKNQKQCFGLTRHTHKAAFDDSAVAKWPTPQNSHVESFDMSTSQNDHHDLSEEEASSVIAMAWSDDTPFEAIALQFGLNEAEVIALMRNQLKTRSFRVWRMRVRGRSAKHSGLQKLDRQSHIHASHTLVQSLARDTSPEEDFPAPSSSLTPASLR